MMCYQIMQQPKFAYSKEFFPMNLAFPTVEAAEEAIKRIEERQRGMYAEFQCNHEIRPIYVEGVVPIERLERALGIPSQVPMDGVPSDAPKEEI